MKIIDLLDKIANGEEVPKKIKVNKIIFEYQGDDYLYKDENKKEYWLFSTGYTDKFEWLDSALNTEVEILEEEKKIPEKLDIQIQNETTGNAYITNEQGTKCYLTKHSKIIAERLNQVIDYLQSKGDE